MDEILTRLTKVLDERRNADPDTSYVAGLHAAGLNRILQKIGEEATETILAARDVESSDDRSALIRETADLWFHSMVMLSHLGLSTADVLTELERRFGTSGIEEKASRSR